MFTRLKSSLLLGFILFCTALWAQKLPKPKNFRFVSEDTQKMSFTWDPSVSYDIEIYLVQPDGKEKRLIKTSSNSGTYEYWKAANEQYKWKFFKARFTSGEAHSDCITWVPTAAGNLSLMTSCLDLDITKAVKQGTNAYKATFNVVEATEKGCRTEGADFVQLRLYFSADSFANPDEDVLLTESRFKLGKGYTIEGKTGSIPTTDKGYLYLQIVDTNGNGVLLSKIIAIK